MSTTIGSISEGTCKTDDLITAFGWELNSRKDSAHKTLIETAFDWLEDDEDDRDDEEGHQILDKLTAALEEVALPYTYFGAMPGDSSCFGFWPCMEQVDELPRCESGDPIPGEDCVFVNDHGNITVYGGDGKVIWDCV